MQLSKLTTKTDEKESLIDDQASSMHGTKYIEQQSQEPSYQQLNNKLMFPNNPAYFTSKKAKTGDQSINQTLLDYCREQGIAFTDTDKVMYNLQTSKKLHHILKDFM